MSNVVTLLTLTSVLGLFIVCHPGQSNNGVELMRSQRGIRKVLGFQVQSILSLIQVKRTATSVLYDGTRIGDRVPPMIWLTVELAMEPTHVQGYAMNYFESS